MLSFLESIAGRPELEQAYRLAVQSHETGENSFWNACIEALSLTAQFEGSLSAASKVDGPLLFISNHPFGLIDGLLACKIASELRPNFKILVHKIFCSEIFFKPYFLPIDFDGDRAAIANNISTNRKVIEALKNDEAIIIFPAAGISTSPLIFDRAIDSEWKRLPATLIKRCHPTVIPLHFEGQNSRFFQLASHLSMTLRLALIAHETKRKIGETIRVTVGNPIPPAELASYSSDGTLMDHLRRVVLELGRKDHFLPPEDFIKELRRLQYLPKYLRDDTVR